MPGIQSLHSHTTTSDGKYSHSELLDAAKKNNISVIAFTDHDSVPDEKTIKELNLIKKHPTKWIIGTELSSGLPKEMIGETGSGFHIVGLFVDPTDLNIQNHCKMAREARIDRMVKIVSNLQKQGFEIKVEDCLKASNGETVGRPHIVEALQAHPQNLQIIESLRKKMEKEAQISLEVKEKYDNMINRGERQYPYVLFLSQDAYIKGIMVDSKYEPDMDKTISIIRQAGGLAIVAHYSTIKNKINPEMLIRLIKEKRIDGIETVYGISLQGTEEGRRWSEDEMWLRSVTAQYDTLESGGADLHSQEDLIMFAQSGNYANQTIGLAERIIAKSKVDTTWSSF